MDRYTYTHRSDWSKNNYSSRSFHSPLPIMLKDVDIPNMVICGIGYAVGAAAD